MTTARPEVVGGFVLGGLAIVVAAILFFGGGNLFNTRIPAVVFFEGSVDGLSPGAAVTFRGVRVGQVSRVALVVDPASLKARIPVYLELVPEQVTLVSGAVRQPMLHRLVEAGLRAKLVSQSLITGQMQVELDLNPETPAHFLGDAGADVPEIPAVPSDLQELREQLRQAPIAQTIAQALRTLITVEKTANDIDGQVGPLATRVSHLLGSTEAAIQRVQQDASATLDETHGLVSDARQQLGARGTELSRTLDTADATLHTINGLMTSASGLVAQRTQARTDLEATLRDLAASASAIRDFSQTIERDPSTVLRGRASR